MDSLLTSAPATFSSTDRINNALATLRSEMLDLRQQDGQLMQQLMRINDNIKTLSKRRQAPSRSTKKKFSLVKGRRKFINPNESIPEEENPLVLQQETSKYCMRSNLSGSLSSIEDVSSSTEDLSSAESDNDESLSSIEPNF
ncbi:uncharacterized protein LOC110447674 [Mizuhopecten yessoensis]|uniref:Uncharacterized protein n=1 Tax=Mizuhopecten yessoensis TaxID=6573 RepID=A0A210QUS8_MIZYE|nr:uncharacterized protein LOC110447674 [Mizuhopecten yessoensis]OWF52477.1 hypothetical protein KP79_PYT06865 [Mizuhopecten yessoensis]